MIHTLAHPWGERTVLVSGATSNQAPVHPFGNGGAGGFELGEPLIVVRCTLSNSCLVVYPFIHTPACAATDKDIGWKPL